MRELGATPVLDYAIQGSDDLPSYICTAQGDVSSLAWTVAGRTDANENGITATAGNNNANSDVWVATLTLNDAKKDESFACVVSYAAGDSDSTATQFYAIGKNF